MSCILKFTLAACLLFVVQLFAVEAVSNYMPSMSMSMRSIAAGQQQNEDGDAKQPSWKPNNTPQNFRVQVKDNINKADTFREEKTENGEVTGSFATPVDEKGDTWKLTSYRAGKSGFKIESVETVPRDKLFGNSNANEAHINIEQQALKTDYTVKDSDLKAAAAAQAKQRAERAMNYAPGTMRSERAMHYEPMMEEMQM